MDSVSTKVSVGPTHGVQLRPNSAPSIGAPASPARGRIEGLRIRPVTGKRSSTPANSSPSRIVSTPKTWVRPTLWRGRTEPSPPNATPGQANTAVKPSTNSIVPRTARRCAGRPGPDGSPGATVVTVPDAVRSAPGGPPSEAGAPPGTGSPGRAPPP